MLETLNFEPKSADVNVFSKPLGRSTATVLKLQQQLKEQQALAKQLAKENETLKEYEASLSAMIGALGDGLYYLAKVLMECPASQNSSGSPAGNSFNSSRCGVINTNTNGLVAALAQDLQAAELLQMIGKHTISAESSLTTRSIRSGCTAARVREAQALLAADPAAFERQVVRKLQNLTFSMSYHLSIAAESSIGSKKEKLQLLQRGLDEVAVEYVQYVMLLFCVDGMLLPRMCMLNLDTLQEATPAPDLFENVVDAMRPTKEQIRQFAAAARADRQKRAVLVSKMAQLVAEIQQLLDPQGSIAVDAATPSGPDGAANDADGGKLQQQPDAGSSGDTSRDSKTSAAAGSNTISSGAPLQRQSGVEGSSNSAFHPAPWQRFGLASSAPLFEEDTLQKLEDLLVLLQRDLVMWRVLNHNLAVLFLNSSTSEQLARATVTAYPFILRPMEVIQCALRKVRDNE